MKKLLLIPFIAFCFACTKKATPSPSKPTNWIMGKWSCTFFCDTTFYSTGVKSFTEISSYGKELNFIDTSHLTMSGSSLIYDYSLSKMNTTLDYGSIVKGAVYKITKQSPTQIKLDYTYHTNGGTIDSIKWVDIYVKE